MRFYTEESVIFIGHNEVYDINEHLSVVNKNGYKVLSVGSNYLSLYRNMIVIEEGDRVSCLLDGDLIPNITVVAKEYSDVVLKNSGGKIIKVSKRDIVFGGISDVSMIPHSLDRYNTVTRYSSRGNVCCCVDGSHITLELLPNLKDIE